MAAVVAGWKEYSSEEELFVDAANNESNGTERIVEVKEANNSDSQRVKCKEGLQNGRV